MSGAQALALWRCGSCGYAVDEAELAGSTACQQTGGGSVGTATFVRDVLCPECGQSLSPTATLALARSGEPELFSVPPMRYQDAYVWLTLVSAMDVMLTMVVLVALNGFEVNPVAAAVIDTMGFPGATVFKFSVVLLVVIICEIVGRKDDRTGRNLSRAAILISALPVAYSFALIFLASGS